MDRIFIVDGPVWTSAGMTAGIDMALGLVERDMGGDIARATAKMMVVHHRRAGGQSQHSAMFELDAESDRVQDALAFARNNLQQPLTVGAARGGGSAQPSAIYSGVSRRNRSVACPRRRESSSRGRPISARAQGQLSGRGIAEETGFGDRERMRRSFLRTFGQTPRPSQRLPSTRHDIGERGALAFSFDPRRMTGTRNDDLAGRAVGLNFGPRAAVGTAGHHRSDGRYSSRRQPGCEARFPIAAGCRVQGF